MVDDHETPFREEDEPSERERKKLFERVVPELVKKIIERAVETSVEKLTEGPENLRHYLGDIKLPKELLSYLYTQIDDTKTGIYRVVAKEVRDVIEHTQFAEEITKVLTKLSFEIRTEIRFIPNEKVVTGSEEKHDSRFPKPDIKSQVSIKDASKKT